MKELDERTLDVFAQLKKSHKLRLRHVVLWIDGDESRAAAWSSKYKFPVGVISSKSADLKAWNVDPTANDTTVVVVRHFIAGTTRDVVSKGVVAFDQRVIELARERSEHKNYGIRKWATNVMRMTRPRPASPAVASRPSPPRTTQPASAAKTETAIQTVSKTKTSPEPHGGVSIVEARWGAFNGWIDATEQVRSFVKNGHLRIPHVPDSLKGLTDSAPGHRKALIVVYRLGDETRLATVPSQGTLTLPAKDTASRTGQGPRKTGTLEDPSKRTLSLLVAGHGSDNIVRFDLPSGKSTVVAKLANGSKPRSIAVNQAGEIFVALRGGRKNVVKLVPRQTGSADGPLTPVDLTGKIGRFGPGLMGFDSSGLLNVAGDTDRAVMRFNVKTGQLVESIRLRAANLLGLTVAGDQVYAAEYFQKTILRFDLNADPARGAKFIYKSDRLDRPHGMTIGHTGNLFVSNLRNSFIQEFDRKDGSFVRTFLDTRTIGASHASDLHYEPRLERYFLTKSSSVFELSTDGALLGRHQSDALSDGVAIAVLPRTQPTTNVTTALRPGAGLIGYTTVDGRAGGTAFHYEQGKVFQPSVLAGTFGDSPRARRVTVIFRGRVHVPKQMTVKAWVAGGSSNGGHCTLKVNETAYGPLGDDHKKYDIYEFPLGPGEHPIMWILTGGDFGYSMLKFQDPETSQLLPISFTETDIQDVPIDRVIRITSEKRGWPIPNDW